MDLGDYVAADLDQPQQRDQAEAAEQVAEPGETHDRDQAFVVVQQLQDSAGCCSEKARRR